MKMPVYVNRSQPRVTVAASLRAGNGHGIHGTTRKNTKHGCRVGQGRGQAWTGYTCLPVFMYLAAAVGRQRFLQLSIKDKQ
jgi:hypothetical protein